MKSLGKEQYRSELKRIDWDFTGSSSDSDFASFHWYPARYVPQLPGILIGYFSDPGEKILDPFCGSGTTLVEAYKFGRTAVGIDLNPTAVWITRAKLTSFEPELFLTFKNELGAAIESLVVQFQSDETDQKYLKELVPNFTENISWYHPETLKELAAVWHIIERYKDSSYYFVVLTAFSAILKQCCSQDKHWGWVCDNVKPKTFIYKNARSLFFKKLNEYGQAAEEMHSEALELQDKTVSLSDFDVIEGSCIEKLTGFCDGHFDLVVTSPPYFNMTDYVKSQRLSNLWLALDTKLIKQEEIGARHKRGGKNALDTFLAKMTDAFREISRVLKKDHFCCVVLGESPRHQPYLEKFETICNELGFELCDSIARRVSVDRSLFPSLLKENILIMRKR